MTTQDVRRLALELPDAYESEHHGHPDFRNRKGIFATLQPEKERSVLRLPLELAETIAAAQSGIYQVVSRGGGMGWLAADLRCTDETEFRDLLHLAWKARAG